MGMGDEDRIRPGQVAANNFRVGTDTGEEHSPQGNTAEVGVKNDPPAGAAEVDPGHTQPAEGDHFQVPH